MNSKIKSGIIFLSGAVAGAGAALVFIKTKWQKDFEAKREEMIRYYEKKCPERKEIVNDEPKEEPEKTDELEEMKKVIAGNDYSKIFHSQERNKNLSPTLNDDYSETPYEIPGTDFGTQEMYGMVTFYLNNDDELVTDKYEPVDPDDIEDYIGAKNLEKFLRDRTTFPEVDSFYVRNDRLKTDIEILIEPEG